MAKINAFKEMLFEYDVELLTLHDLDIESEPEENGSTPAENAGIKASFYGKYYDYCICQDSGLYFDSIPLSDSRQPGLHVRTPFNNRLNDEEMISYYSDLVHRLGGKVLAYYHDGVAVYNKGNLSTFMETREFSKLFAFYFIDTPSKERIEGWPLDSLAVDKLTMTYFVDQRNKEYYEQEIIKRDLRIKENFRQAYRKKLLSFLVESLQLKKR